MEFSELKSSSHVKSLLWANSGRGKTYNSCHTALDVADKGRRVLYIDTEAEGSSTMVRLIESDETDYTKDTVENIEYQQVDSYEELMNYLDPDEGCHDEFDLIVVDTLDHKHTYALKAVTDAKQESDADWNEYAAIYSAEKQVMECIGQPETNILACIDPDSGKHDKPKGAQTNVKGYFTIVVQLTKDGTQEWGYKILNYVGRSDLIGGQDPNKDIHEQISKEVIERSGGVE